MPLEEELLPLPGWRHLGHRPKSHFLRIVQYHLSSVTTVQVGAVEEEEVGAVRSMKKLLSQGRPRKSSHRHLLLAACLLKQRLGPQHSEAGYPGLEPQMVQTVGLLP